eukprot:TRINITY_DN4123_c0_g1_i1.p1 TRINITY_DN4123_c0_g1~~TRINITY_DN4123_c0_g1_i1.p1  ORF type:complete len:342 (+),score=60.13 TRINITY_DN4123_c0_g1_i1:47-1072(+)
MTSVRNTRKSILSYYTQLPDSRFELTTEPSSLEDRLYLEAVIKTVPGVDPKELADLHYRFVDGKIQNITSGSSFHWVNQTHYDLLGDFVTSHIQTLMKEDGYEQIWLPLDAQHSPRCNIFTSPNFHTCNKLIVLIQGSGAVRAGQWARALCINDSLETGSILPYLNKAQELGYGVIVPNPNFNEDYEEVPIITRDAIINDAIEYPKKVKISENSTPFKHVHYVWENLINTHAAEKISIIAHSAGGYNTVTLANLYPEYLAKVISIAFTDSVHSPLGNESHTQAILEEKAKNWVTSNDILDTPVYTRKGDAQRVSAGHVRHEYTSASAIESVFAFLEERNTL